MGRSVFDATISTYAFWPWALGKYLICWNLALRGKPGKPDRKSGLAKKIRSLDAWPRNSAADWPEQKCFHTSSDCKPESALSGLPVLTLTDRLRIFFTDQRKVNDNWRYFPNQRIRLGPSKVLFFILELIG